mgnify:CR=1 FL=1
MIDIKNESIMQTDSEIVIQEIILTEIIKVDNDTLEKDRMMIILMDNEDNMIVEIEVRVESYTEEAINNL